MSNKGNEQMPERYFCSKGSFASQTYCGTHEQMQCGTCLLYECGKVDPRYPVPALHDVYPDPEYIMMLYEHALLTRQLAELRGVTFN
jgi:hypothetical protein